MNILGEQALYHKLVYEVRYEQGFVYLDRCGTTANRIAQNYPEWIINSQSINPQQAPLVHALTGIQFSFGPIKYDFSLDQRISSDAPISKEDVNDFIREVESVSEIVNEELELSKFTREGFRVWYVFPTTSERDSRDWICKFRGVSIQKEVTVAFGGALESLGYTMVIDGEERKFRISVNAVERTEKLDVGSEFLRQLPRNLPKKQREHLLAQLQAKRRLLLNPQSAVMIDVDAYIEDPIEIAPTDFITESLKTIERALPIALSGGGL
jgi:hypothetical protein